MNHLHPIPLGSRSCGVLAASDANDNPVGGLAPGQPNFIANNSLRGVAVHSSVGVSILSNPIFDNGSGLEDGIQLSSGGNNNQQAPDLNGVLGAQLDGFYDKTNPGSTFFLQVFRQVDGKGVPVLVFSDEVTTDAGPVNPGKFSVTLDAPIAFGDDVFASATVASNTSEFDAL